MQQRTTSETRANGGEFCRTCGGCGSLDIENGHGGYVAEDCDRCLGTGFRTVLLFPEFAVTETARAAE